MPRERITALLDPGSPFTKSSPLLHLVPFRCLLADPPADRAHIFDAFYTSRSPKTASVKGTGIGLSVVLEFVSAHGGTVEIVDGKFPGAHFRITMPVRPSVGDHPAKNSSTKAKERAHAA